MKKLWVLIVLAIFSYSTYAHVRTEINASQMAAEAIAELLHSKSPSNRHFAPAKEDMKLVMTLYKQSSTIHSAPLRNSNNPTTTDSAEPALYVFNSTKDGFAVISADERTTEVLCVSETGSIDPNDINPALRWWLERFAAEISLADEKSIPARAIVNVEPIEPLLGDIAWGQLKPYNNFCPIDSADNTRCYAGCIATAAAQIMYYWKYPEKGKGQHSYTWKNYDPTSLDPKTGQYTKIIRSQTLSANFGETEYQWDKMLPKYASNYNTANAKAVATLMSHIGIACEMDYGGIKKGGSAAFIGMMAIAFNNYFDYTYDTYIDQLIYNYSITYFETAFNKSLEAGKPIYMRGTSSDKGGHAFICDGRNANGYFHINWGWSGSGNCYTTLSSMQPSNNTTQYKYYLAALCGICPRHQPINVDTLPTFGKCGDDMYWTCEQPYKTLTIKGEGEMYDFDGNNAPWKGYKNDIDTIVFESVKTGITSIGNEAFNELAKVKTITIPETVTSIGIFAFYSCLALERISLPDSLQQIGGGAFALCENLTEIVIPANITDIEDFTFYSCLSLTKITLKPIIPPSVVADAFEGVERTTPLYVPRQSITLYQTADVWKEFLNIRPIDTDDEPSTTTDLWLYRTTEIISPCKILESGKFYLLMPDGTKYSLSGSVESRLSIRK